MGAFGAALIARERYEDGKETTMLSIDKINELKYTTSMRIAVDVPITVV